MGFESSFFFFFQFPMEKGLQYSFTVCKEFGRGQRWKFQANCKLKQKQKSWKGFNPAPSRAINKFSRAGISLAIRLPQRTRKKA